MPEEPNNSMESQVKAYAETRRLAAGDPLELHPATRQLLQAEVARTLSAGPGPHRQSLWSAFWMRLLWAGGAGALAAWALLLVLERHPQEAPRLAMGKAAPTAEEASEIASGAVVDETSAQSRNSREWSDLAGKPAPSPDAGAAVADPVPSAPMVAKDAAKNLAAAAAIPPSQLRILPKPVAPASMARSVVVGVEGQALKQSELIADAKASIRPDPVTREMEAKTWMGEKGSREMERLKSQSQVSIPAAPMAPMASATSTINSRLSSDLPGDANAQQVWSGAAFQQVAPLDTFRRNVNSPPMPRVLQQFEYQQAGNFVRVVDADGSVYVGHVTNQWQGASVTALSGAVGPSAGESLKRKLSETTTSGDAWQRDQVDTFFAVIGTNQSLKLRVVFSGRVQNGFSTDMVPQAVARQSGPSRQGSNIQSIVPQMKIEGRASVGERIEVPVEAVPARP